MLVQLYLVGVLIDGSKLDERCAPDNPRRPIRYVHETSMGVSVRVLHPSGVSADLTGATVTLNVRELNCCGEAKELTGAITGSDAVFELLPDTFRVWQPGHHAYDVRVVLSDLSEYAVIPTSPFIIEP